tara:strand:- start:5 stop:1078 length:1074 start_codon:yes stop_codon:yes gene_type:complete
VSAEQSCLQRCADLRLGRNNLFDLVRLYAAVQVLLVHGQVHLGLQWPSWLMQCFSLPGVPLFFSISGCLVGLSWLRLQSQWRIYAWHRGLRIFPALWFCLLSTVLILIAAGKTGFLLSPQGGLWLLAQATVVQVFNPDGLRDIGVGVINGSLWTIPVELQFYAALPLLVQLCTFRRNLLPAWTWLMLAGILSYGCWLALPALGQSSAWLEKFLRVSLIPHLFQFLLGFLVLPLLACFGRQRTIMLLLGLALALLVLQRYPHAPLPLLQPLLWSALPLGIGLIPCRSLHFPDLSYGLYLFHMPLVNVLLLLGLSGSASLMPYLGGAFVLASVSWKFVEEPALARKPTLGQTSSFTPMH